MFLSYGAIGETRREAVDMPQLFAGHHQVRPRGEAVRVAVQS